MITWDYEIDRHAWIMSVDGAVYGMFRTKEDGYDQYSKSIRTVD